MIHQAARSRRLLPALALVVLLPAVARATSFSWISPSGQFNSAGNWTQSGLPVDADGIPDANDATTFDRGNVTLYPVYFGNLLVPNSDIHPTVDKVVIGNNPLSFVGLYGSTLAVDSANITETARGVVIGADAGDVAALTSTLATFDTQYATFGSAAGSSGTLNLTSASAGTFSVSGTGATYDLIVGLNGTGTINVTNGRDVTVADDTVLGQNATGVGNVSVSGASSTWANTGDLTVGFSGSGSIAISSEGKVSSDNAYLGFNSGSTGQLTINGDASSWAGIGGSLYVGNSGGGTLNLSGGGDILDDFGYIGNNSGSIGTATVTGAGSVWYNTIDLYVGNSGNGSLDVDSGGRVDTNDLYVGNAGNGTLGINTGGQVIVSGNSYIGDDADSMGNATIDGADSAWTNTGNLYVGNAGTGTLAVSNTAEVGSNGNLYVGSAGTGTISITSGGVVSNVNAYIGDDAGAIGTTTVNGIGSTWANSGELYVGNVGNGTLNVGNGGEVSSNGNIYIGNSDSGTLHIAAGGHVNNVFGYIGNQTGSSGEVTVDGSGSTWDAVLSVGVSGSGSVSITNGGTVIDNDTIYPSGLAYIGRDAGAIGDVTVDGTDSSWRAGNRLYVGYEGQGSLNITNGSIAGALDIVIGSRSGSTGSVGVDGLGSSLVTSPCVILCSGDGSLVVGGAGSGTLSVTNGGLVISYSGSIGAASSVDLEGDGSEWIIDSGLTIRGALSIGNGGRLFNHTGHVGGISSIATATVDGVGSQWGNRFDLYVGENFSGTVSVINGAVLHAENIFIGETGEIQGNGLIDGNVKNGGIISPGTSTGAFSIDGNYIQNYSPLSTFYGELLIELASASSYDQLLVTGTATLAGTLTVNLIEGFLPSPGQAFAILTADDVDSTFVIETLPSVPNLAFGVVYNAQSVVLTVLSALPGDYNGNGNVDAADYTVWRNSVGGSSLPNEGASPGTVDELDYDFWKMHFGESAGGGSAGASPSPTAVPEPATFVLLFVGMLAMSACRRAARTRSHTFAN